MSSSPSSQEAELVVGYNIRGFDYEVLRAYTDEDLQRLPTFDIMYDLEERLGFRPKLDSVASATLGTGKSADGLQALEWWRLGEVDKIIDYCREDVRVTRDLYDFGKSETVGSRWRDSAARRARSRSTGKRVISDVFFDTLRSSRRRVEDPGVRQAPPVVRMGCQARSALPGIHALPPVPLRPRVRRQRASRNRTSFIAGSEVQRSSVGEHRRIQIAGPLAGDAFQRVSHCVLRETRF